MMSYIKPKEYSRRMMVIAAVLLTHVALLYALIHVPGLSIIQVVREPFEVRLAEEPPQPSPLSPPLPAPPASASVPATSRAPAQIHVPAPEVPVPTQPPTEADVASITNMPVSQAPTVVSGQATDAVAPGPGNTAAEVELDRCVKPEYPVASLQAEESGTVALSFLVDVDGKVLESRVDSSSGHRRLDEAARRALARCKFRPARVDGSPRRAWARITYKWRLE